MAEASGRRVAGTGADPTAEAAEINRILRERAKKLAAQVSPDEESAAGREIVEFLLGGERYGIESTYIREVYPLKEYTVIPCTPAFVLGVINIRGQVLSVVDIGRFFELPARGIADLNRVIVLAAGDLEFGILADEVVGVRVIAARDLQPSLPTLTGIRAEYLKGVTGDRVTVLDAARILDDKNLIVHQEVL